MISYGILAQKHDAQQTARTYGLEGASSRIPNTRRYPRRRTPRADAAHGGLVRVLNLDAAGVVHRSVELKVCSDRIVLPGEGVQCLLQGLAALPAIGARRYGGREGILAAVVDVGAGRAEIVGRRAKEADHSPGGTARSGGRDAGFEAAVGNDGGRAGASLDRGGGCIWNESGEEGYEGDKWEMHVVKISGAEN